MTSQKIGECHISPMAKKLNPNNVSSTDPGPTIKREYKCKGGKCDVTVSFIVQDDPHHIPPASTVQDAAANMPAVPQAVASADTPSGIEEVTGPTPSVRHTQLCLAGPHVSLSHLTCARPAFQPTHRLNESSFRFRRQEGRSEPQPRAGGEDY